MKAQRKKRPSMFPKSEAPMEIDAHFRALLNISYCSPVCLMKSTAYSYFIPSSISASAIITGARPKPATQCTATQESGFSRNLFFSNSNYSSTHKGGGVPSSNSRSVTLMQV